MCFAIVIASIRINPFVAEKLQKQSVHLKKQ